MKPLNRREFLGAMAVSAVATTPLVAQTVAPATAGPRKVKLGLIGCGWYGLVDVKSAFRAGGAEVVALCDVDSDMLAHIALRRSEGLAGIYVASADGQAFRQPLEEIARDGTPATVVGFREHASWALASDTLDFVDLEDIPGVFREPLPRIGLDSLPDQGAWLQPFRPLSALLSSRA